MVLRFFQLGYWVWGLSVKDVDVVSQWNNPARYKRLRALNHRHSPILLKNGIQNMKTTNKSVTLSIILITLHKRIGNNMIQNLAVIIIICVTLALQWSLFQAMLLKSLRKLLIGMKLRGNWIELCNCYIRPVSEVIAS